MKSIILAFLIVFLAPIISAQNYQSVIFSEIAWMGNHTSSNDEWIELKNNSSWAVSLNWWIIEAEDWSPVINLSWSIVSYFLLERTDDFSASWVAADMFYSWSLWNAWELLFLKNSSWEIVDKLSSWLAWDNFTKETMMREEDLSWINWEINWYPQNSSFEFQDILDSDPESLTWEFIETWSVVENFSQSWNDLAQSWSAISQTWWDLSQAWSDIIKEDVSTWTVVSDSWSSIETWSLILEESWSQISDEVQVQPEKVAYKVVANEDYDRLSIEEKEEEAVYKSYKLWDVIISEFVTDPQQDWSAWDYKYAWSWKVDSQDEWIELYNPTNLDIDLTSWTLLMKDTSPVEIVFKPKFIKSNSYFVQGNPAWSMNNNIKLILKDANWNLIDEFQLPWKLDWNAKNANDESVSRIIDLNKIVKTKSSPWEKNVFKNLAPKSIIKIQSNWKTFWTWEISLNVTWDDSFDSDGDNFDYFWDFWDWYTFTWSNPSFHKYTVWNYILKLEVRDIWGNVWSSLLNIKVNKLEEKQKTDTVKTIEEKIEKIESVNLKKAVVEPKKQIFQILF